MQIPNYIYIKMGVRWAQPLSVGLGIAGNLLNV